MTTKVADSKGRIALGSEFAGHMFIVNDSDPNRIIITPAVAIPANEAWLYRNETARELVSTGLQQARTGQFSEAPPDIEKDASLAGELEG